MLSLTLAPTTTVLPPTPTPTPNWPLLLELSTIFLVCCQIPDVLFRSKI